MGFSFGVSSVFDQVDWTGAPKLNHMGDGDGGEGRGRPTRPDRLARPDPPSRPDRLSRLGR
jgi:hypothetical protein